MEISQYQQGHKKLIMTLNAILSHVELKNVTDKKLFLFLEIKLFLFFSLKGVCYIRTLKLNADKKKNTPILIIRESWVNKS